MYARRLLSAFLTAAATTSATAQAAELQRGALRIDVSVEAVDRDGQISADSLRNLVAGRLRVERGVSVVASRDEHVKLVELKKKSYEPRFDDALQAELGREVSANVLLRVAIRDALPRHLLELELLSSRESTIAASSVVEWTPLAARDAVDRAVSELLAQLERPIPAVETALPVDEIDVQSLLDDPETELLAIFPRATTSTRTDRGLRIVRSVLAEKSYLWSWRGELLVAGGSAAEVSRAIDRAQAKRPRVHLAVSPPYLEDRFRRELAASPRIAIAESPNCLLEISAGNGSRVELKLLSLDRAELIAAAVSELGTSAALFDAMRRPADRVSLTPHEAEIERAWRELYPVVIDGAIDRALRLAAITEFLGKFPIQNHRRRQADLIRAAIEE